MIIHWLKDRPGGNTLQQHSVSQNATVDSDIVHGVVHHPAQEGAHGVVHHSGQGAAHGGAGGGGLQQGGVHHQGSGHGGAGGGSLQQGGVHHQGEWNMMDAWSTVRNEPGVTWKPF